MLLFSNNAETTLAEPLTGDSGDPDFNTITAVADGSATTFRYVDIDGPNEQLATLTHPSMPGIVEVVAIVGHNSGTGFTVERAVETVGPTGSGPHSWPEGTKMSARVTADTLRAFPQADHRKFLDVRQSELFAFSSAPGIRFGRHRVMNKSGLERSWLDRNFGVEVVGCTDFVDLGAPPVWGADTYYELGAVVAPPEADGYQYWFDPLQDGVVSYDSEEPIFSGYDGVTHATQSGAHVGYWVPTPLPVETSVLFDHALMVTEVGFVTNDYESATATTPPVISVGAHDNLARFVSSATLSLIGVGEDNPQFQRFPVAEPGGELVRELKFVVETAATGGVFRGRFYWRGIFFEA